MTVSREAAVKLISDPNEIVRCKSPQQRPFVRITFDTGQTVELSFQLMKTLTSDVEMCRHKSEVTHPTVVPMARKNRSPRDE